MYIHIVQGGDSLYAIARRYRVSVARLISDNGLRYPYPLVVGQALIVTRPAVVHTVLPGESLYTIAITYGITARRLMQNNPELAYGLPLYPGQSLTIAFEGELLRKLEINGYIYPHVNRQLLKRTLPFLSYLSIFSYGIRQDGEIRSVEDTVLLDYAKAFQAAPVLVLTSEDEYGNFLSYTVTRLFTDLTYQDRFLSQLIDLMLAKGYRGLDSDFEFIPLSLRDAYVNFLSNAQTKLHQAGLFLHVALAPKTSADQAGLLYEGHPYQEVGQIADRVLLMTYEWGYTYGPPMAVAPLPQVKRVLDYGVLEIPPANILMGIPNYGYDWSLPYQEGQSRARSLGNEEAVTLAAQMGAEIRYDERAQSPYFTYRYGGVNHEVWFEDVRSIQAKYRLLDTLGLAGAGYWNLMRPFAQNWAYVACHYEIAAFPSNP